MKKLKIAVVGGGGVGGYLAAKLTQHKKADVKLLARGKHLEMIRKEGLKVLDAEEEFTIYPDTAPPEKEEVFDVVFLTVKSYDFQSACALVSNHIDAETLIIPLANGVGHREVIAEYLRTGIICEGCVYIISHIERPGVIRKKSPLFYLVFGAEEIVPKMEMLAEVLQESELKAKLSKDAAYDCWKKYLFIATFATLTAYHKEPMDVVFAKYRDEVDQLLTEIKSVANAKGIPIGENDTAKVIKQAENLPKGSKTSMQLDFEAEKRTELESLSGYIVHEAERAGLEVPLMQKCYEKLKGEDVWA
jgi:2-dehydropantoate 2-reductase